MRATHPAMQRYRGIDVRVADVACHSRRCDPGQPHDPGCTARTFHAIVAGKVEASRIVDGGMPMRRLVPALFGLVIIGGPIGCDDGIGPIPPPGPHFTVSPIPLDSIARIHPLGHNNKILPIGHSYWDTCDVVVLFKGDECHPGRLPIRSPGHGRVRTIEAGPDGSVTIEGPPGFWAIIAHVTPAPGLREGDRVNAGEVIATMFLDHGFDFGVLNYGREPRRFLRQERYPDAYVYAEHPIEQYPEPLRSQLAERVHTFHDPLGRLSYDSAGTAQGNWFKEGTPVGVSLRFDYAHAQLFLGPLAEREETNLMIVGEMWSGMEDELSALDAAAPSWDEITPASGVMSLRLWRLNGDGLPTPNWPHGTALVEMVSATRLRLEWFDTHEPVSGFTPAARIYER
jgi:hypothetical protein